MSTQQQTEEKNIKIVRRSIEALNTGDVTKASEFIHPNYFNHESQASPERAKLRGPEEFVDTVKKLRAAFSDLHYEEQESIASNDKVVSIMIVTGKHTGDFFGIPPKGSNFSYQAAHISRIADDKIVEHKAIRDDLRFMMQLGVIGVQHNRLYYGKWRFSITRRQFLSVSYLIKLQTENRNVPKKGHAPSNSLSFVNNLCDVHISGGLLLTTFTATLNKYCNHEMHVN
jgi:predicted ester cyclase